MKKIIRFFSGQLTGLLFGLALFIPSTYAASAYTLFPGTMVVGTPTTLKLEYVLDTAQQTWADADTLSITTPANILPWGSLTYTVEHDTDSTNNGVGETAIPAGAGNGEYAVVANLLTIKWNATAWGAPASGHTLRVLIDGAVLQYKTEVATSFTFLGATAAPADTTPSGQAIITGSAADANALFAFEDNTVAAVQNTTITFSIPLALANLDTVSFLAPAGLDVSGVAYVSDTFGGAGSFDCVEPIVSPQTVACTTNGAITAGTGNLVLSGIVPLYKTEIGEFMNDFRINDTSAGPALLAEESNILLPTIAHAEANATMVLATPSVGASSTLAITFTIPFDFVFGDSISFIAPDHLNVNSVSYVSDTFAGAGSFDCMSASPWVACEANGTITAGTGTVVIGGILITSAATGQIINNFEAEYLSADSSVPITDTFSVGGSSNPSVNRYAEESTGPSEESSQESQISDNSDGEMSSVEAPSAAEAPEKEPVTVTEAPFQDIPANSPFAEAVQFLKDYKIIQRSENGKFYPKRPLSRYEMTIIMTEFEGKVSEDDIASYKNCFPDVQTQWFARYVCYSKSKGWVKGYVDGNYYPDKIVSRAEALKIIFLAAKAELPKKPVAVYLDTPVYAWYIPYVQKAKELGLLPEDMENFEPNKPSTYAFMAETLYGVFLNLK